MVYIREAHPSDEWQMSSNVTEGVEFLQTRSTAERRTVAAACAVGLRLDIPILIDTMDDRAAIAYQAWPERLYLLAPDGTVVYKGGKGPFGFDPEELARQTAAYLAQIPE